jgi:hypothetical protein
MAKTMCLRGSTRLLGKTASVGRSGSHRRTNALHARCSAEHLHLRVRRHGELKNIVVLVSTIRLVTLSAISRAGRADGLNLSPLR